jgi:hypothetical protein
VKLNFWQWVGVVLLLVGLAWWQFGSRQAAKSTAPSGNAATTPTTVP